MPTLSNKWEVYQCPVTGRFVDPFKTLAALHHHAGQINANLNTLMKGFEKDSTVALQLAQVGRLAFGLPLVRHDTGEGTPDAVILAMVVKFAEYVQGKGSGAGNWRSWSLPSVALPQPSAPTTSLPSGSSGTGCLPCGTANSPKRSL